MTFAQIVRARRKALGLTQEDLAAQLQVSQRYVSAVETGDAENPTLETIREFARALGLEPGDLEPLLTHKPTTITQEDANA